MLHRGVLDDILCQLSTVYQPGRLYALYNHKAYRCLYSLDAITRIISYIDWLMPCRGVHGVLLELLSCKPNLHTAVEVTGGNQLFHIVVDTDIVATRIIQILNKGKLGRATFMPLNSMSPPEVTYPDHGSEAVPLMKLLKFNALYAPAMKQVR